ncbi:MAG: type II CRISPR-associated endonuclease Cas1 [Pseudomonadota bacterium]
MSWRSLLIQKPAYLSVSKGNLCLKNNDDRPYMVAIEDLDCLILENPQITLTNALLSLLQIKDVAIIFCDQKHMPCGVAYPFHQHSRQAEIAFLQAKLTKAFKKNLWQAIIKRKILNQAECLRPHDLKSAERLRGLSERVISGDPINIEAQAARHYWRYLFKNFKRGGDDIINAALNYGYSIVRAAISRALSAYGLIPCFGIHHHNMLNAYNLADDLLEVFRPMVDRKVLNMVDTLKNDGGEGLSIEHRQQLVAILYELVLINDEQHSLIDACDKMVMHLVMCIRAKSPDKIAYPLFIDACDDWG